MIQYLSAKNDLQLSVAILDNDGQVVDSSLIAGLKFELFTPHTLDINRVNLNKERYIDGNLYVNSSELKYLAEGQLYLTTKVAFTEDHYYDGLFDIVTTKMLNYYITETDVEMTALESFRSYTLDTFDAVDASLVAIREDIANHKADNINSFKDVSVRIDEMNTDILNEISDLSTALNNKIDSNKTASDQALAAHAAANDASFLDVSVRISDLSTAIHSEIDDLSTNVNNTINQKIADLSSNVDKYKTSNDASVKAIKADIADISTRFKNHIAQNDASYKALDSSLTTSVNSLRQLVTDTSTLLQSHIDASFLDVSIALNNNKQASDKALADYKTSNDASVKTIKADVADISTRFGNYKTSNDASIAVVKGAIEALRDGVASDLQNYYQKTETYSKAEVNALCDAIPKFAITVVSSLPTSNISTTTFYLVKTGDETQNIYSEYVYVNNKWELIGTQKLDLSPYAKKTEIPTKVSQLTNDKGYVKAWIGSDVSYQALVTAGTLDDETLYITDLHPHIPTKVSELDNDSGFITSHQDLSHYATTSYVDSGIASLRETVRDNYAKKSELSEAYDDTDIKQSISDVSTYAHSISVPTKVSQLTNDKGYLTEHQSLAAYVKSSSLATVATSGSYNDLTNKPTIPTVPTKVSAFTNDSKYVTETQLENKTASYAKIVTLTQAQYEALETKDPNTLYITEETPTYVLMSVYENKIAILENRISELESQVETNTARLEFPIYK